MSAPLPHSVHLARRYTKRVVLWIHGGCFTLGNNTWSRSVCQALQRAGITVYTVDFPQGPTNPWPAARAPLVEFVQFIRRQHPGASVGIGGESSGAFYACAVGEAAGVDTCVVLCPVLDPYARQLRLPADSAKATMQLAYFGTLEAMRAASPPAYAGRLTVVAGAADADAEYARNRVGVTYATVPGTHALTSKPTAEALAAIVNGFNS